MPPVLFPPGDDQFEGGFALRTTPFRRRGGEPGDSLKIIFDLRTNVATIELGPIFVAEADELSQNPQVLLS